MPDKKPHYAKVDARWLSALLSRPPVALAVHWLFQGLLAMDTTERVFKLGLDALLWAAFGRILRSIFGLPLGWALALGGFLAHTVNFAFNGQIFGVLKHYGSVRRSRAAFDAEVAALRDRIAGEPSIVYAAAYGSLARGEWSPTSDLDVRLVRAPGAANALRACWFGLTERTRATYRRFPLDLLVLDDCAALDSMMERKTPVVLLERQGRA